MSELGSTWPVRRTLRRRLRGRGRQVQRKLGDAGVHTFLLRPASPLITRRFQSAGCSRPTAYRNGFCLLLPGDRAWLLTYEQARSRAVGRVANEVRKRPKLRYYCSRWPVADVANKLPWTCWSSLVDWALGRDDDGPWGWRGLRAVALPAVSSYNPQSVCYRDAQATGACYCGKVRTESVERAARAGTISLLPGGVVVPEERRGRG